MLDDTRFRWFVTLWVMAFSFHYFERAPTDAWAVLAAGVPCLLRPSSRPLFGLFLAVSGWMAWLDLPSVSNHLVLGLIVNLGLAASAGWLLGRAGGGRGPWLDAARTPAGWTLLVVYFFAVFHKLNADFFDPRVSCAGAEVRALLQLNGIEGVALPHGLIVANAWFTIAIETAILAALAIPRLQRCGVLLGLVFHTGLAAAAFYDFATFVFALYLLLAPTSVFETMTDPERKRRLALAGWGLAGVMSVAAAASGSRATPIGIRWHSLLLAAWLLAILSLLGPLVWAWFTRLRPRPTPVRWRLEPVWLLALPLLALLNGCTGYLGLRTVSNYSMFSNLRTEAGQTNHWFASLLALEVVGYPRDLVEVFDVQIPPRAQPHLGVRLHGGNYWVRRQSRWMRETLPVHIPWIELRRSALLWREAGLRDVRLRYARDGQVHTVPDATTDPVLTAPLPWWIRKFVAFRAVQPAMEPVRCRW